MQNLKTALLFLVSAISALSQSAPATPNGAERPFPLSPPPNCAPWEPAWGYWKPDAPMPWPKIHWLLVDKVLATKGDLDVLFVGDSLTAGWNEEGKKIFADNYTPLKGLGIGMGGDNTRQTLWRLDNKAMEGVHPKVVVLMIGVNNIFAKVDSNEDIGKGVQAVITKIHSLSPSSQILLLSVLPMAGTRDPLNERVKGVNTELVKLAGEKVTFLDMYPHFIGGDGKAMIELYRPDFVHLAEPGYAKWNEVMKPTLIELLKK